MEGAPRALICMRLSAPPPRRSWTAIKAACHLSHAYNWPVHNARSCVQLRGEEEKGEFLAPGQREKEQRFACRPKGDVRLARKSLPGSGGGGGGGGGQVQVPQPLAKASPLQESRLRARPDSAGGHLWHHWPAGEQKLRNPCSQLSPGRRFRVSLRSPLLFSARLRESCLLSSANAGQTTAGEQAARLAGHRIELELQESHFRRSQAHLLLARPPAHSLAHLRRPSESCSWPPPPLRPARFDNARSRRTSAEARQIACACRPIVNCELSFAFSRLQLGCTIKKRAPRAAPPPRPSIV